MIKYLRLGSCQFLGDIDRNPQWTRQRRLYKREIFFANVTLCLQLKSGQAGLTSKARNHSGPAAAWVERRLSAWVVVMPAIPEPPPPTRK